LEGVGGQAVGGGPRAEFRHFPAFRGEAARDHIPDPNDPSSFTASRLDWSARETDQGRAWLGLTRELLAAADGLVAVDWRLDGATLALRANLADRPQPAPAARGRPIWGEPADMLAPCAVLAAVDEA
jgi:hypothetical protein